MYCPRCLKEYRDGHHECADCRVPLAAGVPRRRATEQTQELVTVLETFDAPALQQAKAALEGAGIHYIAIGDEPRHTTASRETPARGSGCRIRVASENAAKARELLKPLRKSDSGTGADTGVGA